MKMNDAKTLNNFLLMQYPRVRQFLKNGTMKKKNITKNYVKHDAKKQGHLRPFQRPKRILQGMGFKIYSSHYKWQHKWG